MNLSFFNLALLGYLLAGIFYFIQDVFFRQKAGIPALSEKKQPSAKFAALLLLPGFISHTLYLLIRWQKAGHFPAVGMHESIVFSVWTVVLVYFILNKAYQLEFLKIPLSLLTAIGLAYASTVDQSLKPLLPALKSNWLVIHVSSYCLGYGALLISFISSSMYLFSSLNKGAPAADNPACRQAGLDSLSYKLVLFAFPFLTLGLTTGAVWAKKAWGSYWSWDPKETFALTTWLVYALYLHLRLAKNWQGRKSALLNLIGFFCVLFTFFGVNYLFKGLHSYL